MSELECLTYGVGHAEDGVCLLIRLGPYRVLLDCGLGDLTPLLGTTDTSPVDLVLCSHAHADHARGLLSLHTAFPQVPIYGSEVTAQLLPLNWRSADAPDPPLFCQALPWRTPVEFMDGLSAVFYPAGHLPGAAAILLTYTPPTPPQRPSQSYTVFYTGDFFLSNSRLVEGLPLEELRSLSPDVLIIEGSYGTARYPHRRQQENQLAERIYHAIAQNQSVLLPTPALGLAQELLLLLRSHHRFTGRDLDIWVDTSIAAGCDAYLEILAYLPATVQNFARHQSLFWDDKIRPRVRRWSGEAFPEEPRSPRILLTDIANPLRSTILTDQDPDLEHWVVFIPHDEIAAGEPPILGNIPPQTYQTYWLSQHCDGPGTTQLIHNIRPQHLIFVHGSPNDLADLTGLEELHNRYQLHLPEAGSLVELPVGETFLQVTPPEVNYEGELVDQETHVEIHLPDTLRLDPRWQMLADTGMVEARWQGDELVLRGIGPQELLRQQGSDRLMDWMDANSPLQRCCAHCCHYRSRRCWNPESPLFEFKVTADGFCPAFEPAKLAENPDDRIPPDRG